MQRKRVITLVGGTGFIGRYIVKRLAESGYRLRVISRNPAAATHLKTAGDPGQIVLSYGNILKPETIKNQLSGSYAVINLVGGLFESGGQNFSALHAQGAERLAKLSRQAGVAGFIHMSALGVDKAVTSRYARSKITGEKAVAAAFPGAVILRPGVVFGAEDDFYNRFALMSRYLPFMPLIGGGNTRFQPVYCGDIAAVVEKLLQRREQTGSAAEAGAEEEATTDIYELGGGEIFTLKQVMQYVMDVTGNQRPFVVVPFAVARFMGMFMEWLPSPLLTADQVRMLQYDGIVGGQSLTMKNLGIKPTPVAAVVPEYLARFSRYSSAKSKCAREHNLAASG